MGLQVHQPVHRPGPRPRRALDRFVLVGRRLGGALLHLAGARLRAVPRDRGQRHRHAVQGIEPDRPGARLPRRPRAHQRVPVPWRTLPLRPTVEPLWRDRRAEGLRRPRAQRGPRHVRELPRHRQPRRVPTTPTAGRRSPAGRATSRLPTRAPTGSGSSAPGGAGCGSSSTTSSRTGPCASSTRSSRTTATRWRARASRRRTCSRCRTTSTLRTAGPAWAG